MNQLNAWIASVYNSIYGSISWSTWPESLPLLFIIIPRRLIKSLLQTLGEVYINVLYNPGDMMRQKMIPDRVEAECQCSYLTSSKPGGYPCWHPRERHPCCLVVEA